MGYRWLDKIWCYKCFVAERDKYSEDFDKEWKYTLVNIKELEEKPQQKLVGFLEGIKNPKY